MEGAFTGALRKGKKGLIEIADGGTIFLDEISEMDLQGQVRLLRVLEERTLRRVGDDKEIPVDVYKRQINICSATRRPAMTIRAPSTRRSIPMYSRPCSGSRCV